MNAFCDTFFLLFIYLFLVWAVFKIMGEIPPEVLERTVLFNKKSRHMWEKRGVYRDLVGKPE